MLQTDGEMLLGVHAKHVDDFPVVEAMLRSQVQSQGPTQNTKDSDDDSIQCNSQPQSSETSDLNMTQKPHA